MADTDLSENSSSDDEEKKEEHVLTEEEIAAKEEAERIFLKNEAKKEKIRSEIRNLKREYRGLAQKNEEIPEQFRVPNSMFILDPRIKAKREKKYSFQLEEVGMKLEWDGCRSLIGCSKIEKFFLKNIETHSQTVTDLEHTVEVQNFRMKTLTQSFLDLYEKNKEMIDNEELLLHALEQSLPPQEIVAPNPVKRFYAVDLIGEFEGKKYDTKTLHMIKSLEERLLKRYIRECEWADLQAQKVPNDYEAPEDVLAIRYAKDNMGDYKLKTGLNYLGEKVTMCERRQRILDLKKMLHDCVMEFNNRVQLLQEEKLSILTSCKKLIKKINERQRYLPMSLRVPLPYIKDMDLKDDPNKIFTVSDDDIEEVRTKKLETAGLLKRKKIGFGEEEPETKDVFLPVKQASKTAQAKKALKKEGDFIRGIHEDERAPKVVLKKLMTTMTQTSGLQQRVTVKHKNLDGLSLSVYNYRAAFFNPKTEPAERKRDRILARRVFERDFLLDELRKIIEYFKNRVIFTRNERIELQLDVKLMSIGLLVLIQELDIVKDFVDVEKGVNERLRIQKHECFVIKKRVKKSKKRINKAEAERQKIEDALNALSIEVDQVVSRKGKFKNFLRKVYLKKIGFNLRIDEMEGEDEEEVEEEEEPTVLSTGSDISFGTVSSSNSLIIDPDTETVREAKKVRLNLNICPEELDEGTYNKICELRKRKFYKERELDGQKAIVDKLNEILHEHEVSLYNAEGKHVEIEEELISLQKTQQRLINNLRRLIILKADQIQCLDENKVEMDAGGNIIDKLRNSFPNIEEVILFPKDGTSKLDKRIDELKADIVREKEKHQRGRHMIMRMSEELKKKENRVKAINEQSKKDMIARFGRKVDLDEVSACIINLEILDALILLESRRKGHYQERDVLLKSINETKHRLANVTITNSEYNTLLAILEERQRDVDYYISQEEKKKNKINTNEKEKESRTHFSQRADNDDVLDEMLELEDRLYCQEEKIAYLRETIAICKFKDSIPPIVQLTTIPDTVGSRFMTFKELQEYKELVSKEVETLYKKQNMTNELMDSHSALPKYITKDGNYNSAQRTPPMAKSIENGVREESVLNSIVEETEEEEESNDFEHHNEENELSEEKNIMDEETEEEQEEIILDESNPVDNVEE